MSAVPRPSSLVPARLTRRFGRTRAAVVTLLGVLGALGALAIAARAAVAAVTAVAALMVDPTWPPADTHMYGPHVVSATSGGQVWYEDRFSAKVLSGVTYHVKVRNPGLTGGMPVPNFSVKLNGVYYATKDSLTNGATEFTKQVPLQAWNKIELWIAAGSGQVSLEIYSQAGTASPFTNVGGVKEVRPQAGLDTVNTVWQVTLPADAGPTHVLAIDNGALNRSGRVGCCEWGEVKLNGTRVFWLDTLHKEQSKVMVPITLQPGTNTLQVIADSLINGAHMFVRVMQAGGSAPPPPEPNWPPNDEPVYGPHTVAATSSGQVWYEDKFSAKLLGGGDRYFVFVRTPSLLGGTAVPNFSVKLNGVYYATKDSLKNGATEFVKQVPLVAWNRIELWIAPGSGKIDLEIYRERMAFRTIGPRQRIEPAAGQTTVTKTWQVTKPENAGPSHLIVLDNGDYDRTKRVGPNEYGKVRLNGSIVFDVDTFHSNTPRAVVPVTLQSGVNTIEVTAGNMGEVGEHFYVRAMYADTAKPVVTVTQPAANPAVVNTSSVTLSGTYQDSVWGYVRVGSASSHTTVAISGNGGLKTWSATRTLSVEGANTIKVWGRDAAFNTSDTLVRTIIRDTEQPTLAVSAPAEGFTTNQSSVTVTASASDANGVTVTANGVTFAAQGGGTYSGSVPLNVGANPITVVATDGGGNTRSVVRNVTRTAPPLAVVISTPTANAITNANAVTVSGTASGGTAPYTVSANGVNLPVNASDGTYSGSVPLTTEEAIAITVTVTDAASATKSEVVNITRDITAPVLTVTAPANGAQTESATIQATGTAIDPRLSTFTLNDNSVVLNGDGSFSRSVPLTIGDNTLRFVATDLAGNATTVVRTATRLGLVTVVDSGNPGTAIDRDECLTIAAGDDAAYECGDLRIVHALPTTRTMNKARTPTLIYNSRHARPVVLVAANVHVSSAHPADSLVATVKVMHNGAQKTATRSFVWNPAWNADGFRRIVVPVDARGMTLPTGAYPYTLEVKAISAEETHVGSFSGSLVVVDRSTSAFGEGWWLDGLEQLMGVGDQQTLWVGGDGTTRVYTRQAETNLWLVIPEIDRVDSLVRVDTVGGPLWRRKLRNGAFVEFDNGGRHVATQNRQRHRTTFGYSGSLLSTITLPVPLSNPPVTPPVYAFNYATEPVSQGSLLAAVDAPALPNLPRQVWFAHDGGTRRINQIIEKRDASTAPEVWVGFKYDAQSRVIKRRNRRDDSTFFAFDEASLLREALIQMDAAPSLVTTFCAAEGRSLTGCASGAQPLSKVYTLLDGPRTDKQDTTAFFLTRFGAPREIVNAIGAKTTIERTHSRFPMLATAVLRPSAKDQDSEPYRTEAFYDSNRGLLESTRTINPYGDGRSAVTTYVWHDKWDAVTSITTPLVERTTFEYDPVTGDRITVVAGGDPTRFEYEQGLVKTIRSSQNGLDQLVYDVRGNLRSHTTPLNWVTETYADTIGRDTLVVLPPTQGGGVMRTRTEYDWADRPRLAVSSGGTGGLADALEVTTTYDFEGNTESVTQRATPDRNAIGAVTRSFVHDPAHRKLREHAGSSTSGPGARSWGYDAAGNVVLANGAVISTYDALNRLERRQGTDTSEFTYDALGNIKTANNEYAQVSRTYYRNGQLESETLGIATADSTALDFTKHQYQIVYTYDLAGRRESVRHPSNLKPGGTPNTGSHYTYDPRTGQLETVTDIFGVKFRHAYDAMGRLDSLIRRSGLADSVIEVRGYDLQSQLTSRVQRHAAGTQIRGDALQYDGRGKIFLNGSTDQMEYNALGHLTYAFARHDERFEMDAMGNRKWTTRSGHAAAREDYTYHPGTGRLWKQFAAAGGAPEPDTTVYTVDGFGNVTATAAKKILRERTTSGDPVFLNVNIGSAYDAENRLTFTRRIIDTTGTLGDGSAPPPVAYRATESYRYDALGRRIWHRSIKGAACTNVEPVTGCHSFVTRTIWDRDNILYEIRTRGEAGASSTTLEDDSPSNFGVHYGVVGYTHGGVIDQPLGLFKGSTQVLPLANYRGQFDRGLCPVTLCDDAAIYFHGKDSPVYGWPGRASGPPSWYGGLIEAMEDASGVQYKRNRYYDPQTGRFTQEDPIGLAGGLNLYGFADGDPVNFSDPFGLHPCCIEITVVMRELAFQAFMARAERMAVDAVLGSVSISRGAKALGQGIAKPGSAIGKMLGKPNPVKANRAGNMQPYDAKTGQYLPYSANPGPGPNPFVDFASGVGQTILSDASGGAIDTPPPISKAQEFGQNVGKAWSVIKEFFK